MRQILILAFYTPKHRAVQRNILFERTWFFARNERNQIHFNLQNGASVPHQKQKETIIRRSEDMNYKKKSIRDVSFAIRKCCAWTSMRLPTRRPRDHQRQAHLRRSAHDPVPAGRRRRADCLLPSRQAQKGPRRQDQPDAQARCRPLCRAARQAGRVRRGYHRPRRQGEGRRAQAGPGPAA